MRVLQIIDSLRSGGAEQMAVSYANALSGKIEGSYLCCTRREGLLKAKITGEVGYVFLNKKHSFDLKAFRKLRGFVVKNKIDLLQAHGTSWFLASLLKLFLPGVKLVWHDHYGRKLKERPVFTLKLFSRLFDGIISVNEDLKEWSRENLNSKNVIFVKNFFAPVSFVNSMKLKGFDDLKIICVANLRPQKDHLNLLQAFRKLLRNSENEISLHLIGEDKNDEYSEEIHRYIKEHAVENVHFYGEQQAIEDLLSQADIGVLSSSSEGLPIALLEYGRAGLPVVCTRVGQCEEVLGNSGKLISPGNEAELCEALSFYVRNKEQRIFDGKEFQKKINMEYSEVLVLPLVLEFFKTLK